MTFAPKNPQIPGTTTPAVCKQERNGKRCGNLATETVSGSIELMGKLIPVKIPLCTTCIKKFTPDHGKYSIKEIKS